MSGLILHVGYFPKPFSRILNEHQLLANNKGVSYSIHKQVVELQLSELKIVASLYLRLKNALYVSGWS